MISRLIYGFLFLFCINTFGQTLKGKVVDALSKAPLESVSVYFNNTTIGTTTNAEGEFSIDYNDAVRSPLIISYLGYEKIVMSDYTGRTFLNVELKESTNQLDEVVISADDGLTRKQKLEIFREQFLGTSKNGRSCKILNEDDLILRYDKKGRQLSVSAKSPLEIENQSLKYHITYELVEFEVVFNYVDLFKNDFNVYSTYYSGSSFFKDENVKSQKSVLKRRQKVYDGSIQHFMRSVFRDEIKKEKYRVFKRGMGIKPSEHIIVRDLDSTNFKEVKLSGKLSVTHRGGAQSDLLPKMDKFYINKYGTYLPVKALFFTGAMSELRMGDTLPLDYNFVNEEDEVAIDDLIEGNWSVISVEDYPDRRPYSDMVDSFKEATFKFNEDKSCAVETTIPNTFFSILTSALNSSKWQLKDKGTIQSIDILNNGNSIMEFEIEKIKNNTYFIVFVAEDNKDLKYKLKVKRN